MEPLSFLPFPGTELGLLRSHHAQEWWEDPKASEGWLDGGAGPGAEGQSHPALALGVAQLELP